MRCRPERCAKTNKVFETFTLNLCERTLLFESTKYFCMHIFNSAGLSGTLLNKHVQFFCQENAEL